MKPRPSLPHVHFTGACGRAVGSLALELQRCGWGVSASDGVMYAPMDRVLREAGLVIKPEFRARNIPRETEMIVAGGALADDNVELVAAKRRGLPILSMAEFLGQHLSKRAKRVVVAGTKGKTTTTALLAWMLEFNGKKPDYLIGGLCPHFPMPVRMRGRPVAVIEGDEYPSSRFDPRPKFFHYRPQVLLVTNIQQDHVEVFPDLEVIADHFRSLVAGLPKSGRLFLSSDCPQASALAASSPAPVERIGWGQNADHRITRFKASETGMKFSFCGQEFFMPQVGKMIALDAALAMRAALHLGLTLPQCAAALSRFQSVDGRLQIMLDEPSATVVIDESAHPSALRENLSALRARYPGRRLIAVVQPRYTGGRDGFHAQLLPGALAAADKVVLLKPFDLQAFDGGSFSNAQLAVALRAQGQRVSLLRRTMNLPAYCRRHHQAGDVLFCSLPPGCDFLTTPLADGIRSLCP